MRVCAETSAEQRMSARTVFVRSEVIRPFMPSRLCKITSATFATAEPVAARFSLRLPASERGAMAEATIPRAEKTLTRQELIDLLNEDLAREYQAVIAYVVYSQVLKGAQYMAIAQELETHAQEELAHALTIAKQIDYLGGQPTVEPKPVRTSKDPKAMLEFDLANENE